VSLTEKYIELALEHNEAVISKNYTLARELYQQKIGFMKAHECFPQYRFPGCEADIAMIEKYGEKTVDKIGICCGFFNGY